MQPSINSYMEQLRSERISKELYLKQIARAREITIMLAEYRGASECPCPLPTAGDIHTLPGVRDTLLDGTDEEFAALKSDIVSRLPQLTAQCYEDRRVTLTELLPEEQRGRDALFLAPTSFHCGRCHCDSLGTREAIHHACGNYMWGPDFRMLLHAGENPWSQTLKGLSFCNLDVRLKEKIVQAVGEDPATITEAGMDLGNHRFLTYSRSGMGGGGLNIFGWRGLVSNVNLLWCYN
jgi:hypothetical protein